MPDQYGKAISMDKAAAINGLTIFTSDFFTVAENVPDIDVSNNFNRVAFSLDPSNPERYFSDPITGENTVYVIAANKRLEAHVPDFSEV